MNDLFEILFEDEHLLVTVKPAGIPTQTKRITEQDMESLLKNYRAGKGEEAYIGVVHRLDQPVEGILVFAKTERASRELSRQVQDGRMGKYYLAASAGQPDSSEGILEDFLEKDGRTNLSRVVNKKTKNSRKAVLRYKVLQKQDGICYIEIALQTGRHHQIRVQSACHGFPLLGDRKYNVKQQADGSHGSLALCAWRSEFIHPVTKEVMKFEIRPTGDYFKLFV